MIERCRNRKAKCDPNGSFQVNRKASMKRRKRNRKHRERVAKNDKLHFARVHMARNEIRRNEVRALDYLGDNIWHNMWLNNGNREVAQIERIKGMKWQVADGLAIQAGRSLMIDKLLDAQLKG